MGTGYLPAVQSKGRAEFFTVSNKIFARANGLHDPPLARSSVLSGDAPFFSDEACRKPEQSRMDPAQTGGIDHGPERLTKAAHCATMTIKGQVFDAQIDVKAEDEANDVYAPSSGCLWTDIFRA